MIPKSGVCSKCGVGGVERDGVWDDSAPDPSIHDDWGTHQYGNDSKSTGDHFISSAFRNEGVTDAMTRFGYFHFFLLSSRKDFYN